MNLLIIDDEPNTIIAVRYLCHAASLGISGILDAANGEQALEIMEKVPVDLILLDMNMPVMDGVEFLKRIGRQNSRARVIVISSHQDFRYTKQSILSNVTDYILKPIDEDELNQALEKAAALLEKQREEERKKEEADRAQRLLRPFMREQVYQAYLNGHGSDFEILRYKRILDMKETEGKRLLLLIQIMNMEEICSRFFKGDYFLFRDAFFNVIEELLSDYQAVCVPDSEKENRITCILCTSKADWGETDLKIQNLLAVLEIKLHAAACACRSGMVLEDVLLETLKRLRKTLDAGGDSTGKILYADPVSNDRQQDAYRIREYLKEHYAEKINIGELGNRYYLSRENLTRLFKKTFQVSPYEYLIQVRMERAKKLMQQNLRLQEIAEQLGYSNENYFSKAFREFYGMTPTEFRAKLSETDT